MQFENNPDSLAIFSSVLSTEAGSTTRQDETVHLTKQCFFFIITSLQFTSLTGTHMFNHLVKITFGI